MKVLTYVLIFILFIGLSSCASRVKSRPATKVTYVKVAPRQHKVVYIKGKKYYSWNGNRYRKTRRGFIIVR